MSWNDLPNRCKVYLVFIYVLSVPFAYISFIVEHDFTITWFLFTIASFFVASINLHLPQTPSVLISMGDVFTVLALVHFGPGPALATYWANVVATAVTGNFRRHGLNFFRKIAFHRLLFNLSSCALSIWTMSQAYSLAQQLPLRYPLDVVAGLGSVAAVWFFVNTTTLSLAVSFSSGRAFASVWREGMGLYLINFFGSAASAGLISLFYERAGFFGFSIFLLSLPVAVVIYQLFTFYIEKYQQSQAHIEELNKLYLQTIESMSNAVDAKDRYTHGHIRRVQAYTSELAKFMGISDEKELMAIKAGSLLHDIGKIAIPEYILNKPTVLTETEFEKMKIHPVVGANMLQNIEFPYPVIPMVKSHHERWDGNGYPEGLKGEEIPLSARILSLADCYDALTTNRPYRSPMPRAEVLEFFRKESGRAYDPQVVDTFINNIEQIEAAGSRAGVVNDVWGLQETVRVTKGRQLEKVEPTVTYSKALNANAEIQRELYSIFEFARADIRCFDTKDILTFMGSKLTHLIEFDSAVFFVASPKESVIRAEHIVGMTEGLLGLCLKLEQKLSGWVAANNQALCNLPPFPDFLGCGEPKPPFQMSAIAPINHQGAVLGALSLYRKDTAKFSEEEFRRLEMVASQTASALSKSRSIQGDEPVLFDSLTGVPNGFQLYLMFDQVATDAARYNYPLALFSIQIDDLNGLRRRWGHMSGDEAVRAAAKYLTGQLRDTDVLVRYAADEFVALSPRMNRDQAEALKSRLQNDLDHMRFGIRADAEIALPVSIGISLFPDDESTLEGMLSAANWRMREDRDLRSAIRRSLRHFPANI